MNVKRTGVKSEREAHWKLVERVVALLEQAIAPGARVEHNVKLLDHESGIMRQCDVVIRQGKPPRETLTIVEVQDRGRRVTLPIFEGWYRKRQKVRAQHLICVSQKGFSSGVIQEARRQAGIVRLLELKELEESAWPLKFRDGKWPVAWPEYEIDSYSLMTVGNRTPGETFKRGDVDFTRNGQPVQLGHIFDEYFPTIGCPPGNDEAYASQRIEFGHDDVIMVIWADGSARVDTITRRLKVKTRRATFKVSASEYKQCDYDGVLAWAIAGTAIVDGKETTLRAIFTPQPNGMLRLAGMQALGAFEDMPLASISVDYESPQTQDRGTMMVAFPPSLRRRGTTPGSSPIR